MQRFPLVALLLAVLALTFAGPARSASAVDTDLLETATSTNSACPAEKADKVHGSWDILCGGEGACGTQQLCSRAIGRDFDGDFYVCRCSNGSASRCCQLLLRVNSGLPEVAGNCTDCGKSGSCHLSVSQAAMRASCGSFGSVGQQ